MPAPQLVSANKRVTPRTSKAAPHVCPRAKDAKTDALSRTSRPLGES